MGPETSPEIANLERQRDSERGGMDGAGELLQPVGDHREGRQDGCLWDSWGIGRERGEELEELGREGEGSGTLQQEEA